MHSPPACTGLQGQGAGQGEKHRVGAQLLISVVLRLSYRLLFCFFESTQRILKILGMVSARSSSAHSSSELLPGTHVDTQLAPTGPTPHSSATRRQRSTVSPGGIA